MVHQSVRPRQPKVYKQLGHDGALVDSITFNRRVVGSTPSLAVTSGPWASPLPTDACALRRETPIQYPCCSREYLWVVEDLKRCYRNGQNEYEGTDSEISKKSANTFTCIQWFSYQNHMLYTATLKTAPLINSVQRKCLDTTSGSSQSGEPGGEIL